MKEFSNGQMDERRELSNGPMDEKRRGMKEFSNGLRTLATLYKKKVHISALNAELFDAIQHASVQECIYIITCGQKQPWK